MGDKMIDHNIQIYLDSKKSVRAFPKTKANNVLIGNTTVANAIIDQEDRLMEAEEKIENLEIVAGVTEGLEKVKEIKDELVNVSAQLDNKALKSELTITNTNVSNLESSKATKTEVDVERKRIDNFISLPQGSTTGDAELIDGRVGADGHTYGNIGSSIRSQIDRLNKGLLDVVDLKYLYTSKDVYTTTGFKQYEGWYSTDYLEVTEDLNILSLHTNPYTSIYAISFFDNSRTFVGGILGSKNSDDLETISNIIIPSNSKYFRIAGLNFGDKPVAYYYNLTNKPKGLRDSLEITNKVNNDLYIKELPLKSLLTSDDIYTTTGFKQFSTWYSTEYIDISGYETINEITSATYTNLYSYSFFDENKVFVEGHYENASGGEEKTYTHVVIPSNAKYIRIIGTNQAPGSLENIRMNYTLKKVDIDKTVENKIKDMGLSSNIFLSTLFQNVLCIGDSLTHGDYGSYPEGSLNLHEENYPFFLSKLTNAKVDNKGMSGYTSKMWWDNIKPTIDVNSKYDCVYIYLGTNDGLDGNVITDAVGDDYNNYGTSALAYYCRIIRWLQITFPKAKIFLVSLSLSNRDPYWTKEVNKRMLSASQRFNVPYLDIFNRSPFTRENGNIYRPVGYDPVLSQYGNLHFGKLGYLTLANCIVNLTSEIVESNLIEYKL